MAVTVLLILTLNDDLAMMRSLTGTSTPMRMGAYSGRW